VVGEVESEKKDSIAGGVDHEGQGKSLQEMLAGQQMFLEQNAMQGLCK